MKTDHKKRAHALLSASGASRWMACTPSARMEDKLPERSSPFTDEGHLAHEIAELKARKLLGLEWTEQRAEELEKFRQHSLHAEEMETCTDDYAQFIWDTFQNETKLDPATLVMLEERLDFSKFVPEGFGTGDAVIVGGKTLHVIDYKHGAGVRVSAVDNPQLKLYGLGALETVGFLYDVDNVVLHVFQPRMDNISSYELSVEELTRWGTEQVAQRAAEAWDGKGKHVIGPHCQFCKAQAECPKQLEAAVDAFEDLSEPEAVSTERQLEIYEQAATLRSYLAALEESLINRALSGEKLEGFKLVAGRSTRKIKDPDGLIDVLTNSAGAGYEDLVNTKLKGLGDLEKLIGKSYFRELAGPFIEKPAGKPSLVPESDKRQSLNPADDFND